MQVQGCTGAANQLWRFEDGQVKIHTGKCLDVTGGNDVNGVKLQVWDCDASNANQKFWYTAWGDNQYVLRRPRRAFGADIERSYNSLAWTDHGKCLDLTNGSLDNGNQVQLWDCSGTNPNHVWDVGYMANSRTCPHLFLLPILEPRLIPRTVPDKSEDGQTGTNACGTGSSQSSLCQTAWINDATDFCLWAPPNPDSLVGASPPRPFYYPFSPLTTTRPAGDAEQNVVAWCTKSGRGTRVIPNGALSGVHFVRTPDYVQVTGVGDFTKLNIRAGDAGGELDPHGPDSRGNPVGGVLFGNTFGAGLQYHEWTSFISSGEFCFRACTGPNARENCQHIYDGARSPLCTRRSDG